MNNRKKSQRPLLLTMGDPAGIGPEIAVKALCGKASTADIVVVGDLGVMREAAKLCGLSPRFNVVAEYVVDESAVDTVDISCVDNAGGADNISINNISTDNISTNNISTDNISTNNFSTNNISTNNISTDNVSTNNISTDNVSTNNISTNNISTNNISTDNISTDNVSTDNISTSNINTGGIDDVGGSVINIIDVHAPGAPPFPRGVSHARCGRAAYRYVTLAIDMALSGRACGVVTGPISKESLSLAGIGYPGHTEIFADRTGAGDYSMVFLLDGVAVAHVTTHVSLRAAIEMVTAERVLRQIRLLRGSLAGLGISEPRMAVSGLNPHAGEGGLFGDEEIREIAPAVARAREEGIDVAGPLPPDTVFNRAFKGEFNGVVSMLHDHGFVALKSRDFEHGVNITVGLPIIRTSVGHGTAFDIAWAGRASCESLLSAIEAAKSLLKN